MGVVRMTPAESLVALPRDKMRGIRIQQILDDGQTALVVRAPAGTITGPAMLLDLRSAEVTPLMDRPVMEIRYGFGELVTVMPDGSITATPFDLRRRKVAGTTTQIATGVMLSGTGIAQFAVADNGTLAYIPQSPGSLVLVSRDGREEPVVTDQLNVHAPRFSPDGGRLSFDMTSADGRDIGSWSLERRTLTRATVDRDGHDGTWSPDGRFLTYISLKSGTLALYRTRPGSTAPAESLFASPKLMYTGTWLQDGSALITTGNDLRGTSNSDVVRLVGGGRGPIEPLVASSYDEAFAVPSPNGRWLAFVSTQSGTQEVYVQPLDGDGDQVQISHGGGTEPVWAPDSRELFFRSLKGGRNDLAVAALKADPALSVVGQRTLFPVDEMVSAQPHANYDISPVGQRFAMVRRNPGSHIVVMQNVPALLRRLRSAAGAAP